MYAVSSYDSSGTEKVLAFGDYDGNDFCCESNTDVRSTWDGTEVDIIGSDYSDILSFQWNGGSGDTLEYSPSYFSTSAYITDGIISGGSGADSILGSTETDAGYVDQLHGDDGMDSIHDSGGADMLWGGNQNDTLNGDAGDDQMWGDGEDDTMNGGDGIDDMHGGAGNDIMLGNAGTDTMYGDSGNDHMGGGDESDYMDGGAGDDVLCGDLNGIDPGDELHDGDTAAGVDILYGGSSTDDDVYCNNASTQVDANSNPHGTCSGTSVSSRPAQCP